MAFDPAFQLSERHQYMDLQPLCAVAVFLDPVVVTQPLHGMGVEIQQVEKGRLLSCRKRRPTLAISLRHTPQQASWRL